MFGQSTNQNQYPVFSGRDLTGRATGLLIQTSLPQVCDPKGQLKFRLVNTEAQRFLI